MTNRQVDMLVITGQALGVFIVLISVLHLAI